MTLPAVASELPVAENPDPNSFQANFLTEKILCHRAILLQRHSDGFVCKLSP
jgi:hypothetical protein